MKKRAREKDIFDDADDKGIPEDIQLDIIDETWCQGSENDRSNGLCHKDSGDIYDFKTDSIDNYENDISQHDISEAHDKQRNNENGKCFTCACNSELQK